MVKEFCLAWEKNKGELEEYFRTTKQCAYGNYEDLVRLIFDIIINPEIKRGLFGEYNDHRFDTDNILVIDDGDYQGTQVFVLHQDRYQPSITSYVYTNVGYGSCSYCDTLQNIQDYKYNDLPDDEQVTDYMTLCLHLLQKCNFMVD